MKRSSDRSKRRRRAGQRRMWDLRSEEHTSELQSRLHLVCRLLLDKKHALSVTHNNYLAYNNRGLFFDRAGRLHEATADYRQDLAIKSDDAEANHSVGQPLTKHARP